VKPTAGVPARRTQTLKPGAPAPRALLSPSQRFLRPPRRLRYERSLVTPASDQLDAGTHAKPARSGLQAFHDVGDDSRYRRQLVPGRASAPRGQPLAREARSGRTRRSHSLFSRTVCRRRSATRAARLPDTSGTWHQVNSHTMCSRLEGYGLAWAPHVTVGCGGHQARRGEAERGSENGGVVVPPARRSGYSR